jgi:hypothetical protein
MYCKECYQLVSSCWGVCVCLKTEAVCKKLCFRSNTVSEEHLVGLFVPACLSVIFPRR